MTTKQGEVYASEKSVSATNADNENRSGFSTENEQILQATDAAATEVSTGNKQILPTPDEVTTKQSKPAAASKKAVKASSTAAQNTASTSKSNTRIGTFSAKPSDINHEWFVVDATDKVLGRLAAKIAHVLRGKHKAIYTPHMDTGDFIVVTNADKLVVTGRKTVQKIYYRHTGYPGGIYSRTFNDMLNKHPEKILINAVKGMLPKGPLGYAMLKKLKVYADTNHPHSAQQPKQLVVE